MNDRPWIGWSSGFRSFEQGHQARVVGGRNRIARPVIMDEINQFICTPKTVVINELVSTRKKHAFRLCCAADGHNLAEGFVPRFGAPFPDVPIPDEFELGGDVPARIISPLKDGVAASEHAVPEASL